MLEQFAQASVFNFLQQGYSLSLGVEHILQVHLNKLECCGKVHLFQ